MDALYDMCWFFGMAVFVLFAAAVFRGIQLDRYLRRREMQQKEIYQFLKRLGRDIDGEE